MKFDNFGSMDLKNFRGNFHGNSIPNSTKATSKKKINNLPSYAYERYEKARERKINRIKARILNNNPKPQIITDKHEYEYKQFGQEPKIEFSAVTLAIFSPIFLCINMRIAKHEGIPMVQYLFVTMFIAFIFNMVYVLRRNRLMPFLPETSMDNKLKIASALNVIAVFLCLKYGWNASGGMIFSIVWQFINGKRGSFYLIIFGAIVASSITIEYQNLVDELLQFIPSILFGLVNCLLQSMQKKSTYAIANQISFFLFIACSALYMVFETRNLNLWQYTILIGCGFFAYYTVLFIVKLMQTQRVSIATGIMNGIIIIGTTQFKGVSDYVASLTIVLSILVLLKIQYIDNQS